MNIALLGFDLEGRASYDYFSNQGHQITICDQDPNKEVPEGAATQLGDGYLDNLDRFDLLVRTPGLIPAKILEKNPGIEDKITSGVNEFFRIAPTKNIIGVTGTKGKGTTSTLITKLLEAAGKKVFLGGNIGVPVLSFINEVTADDWAVLELSSFMLSDIRYSPHTAVCLLVVPEHLNWHKDMDDYIGAKRRLFIHQTPDDLMVYNADNAISQDIASSSPAQKLWYSTLYDEMGAEDGKDRGAYVHGGHIYMQETEICSVGELSLLGTHNWQNVCAALTATWDVIGRDRELARSVVTTFTGLPFRIEHRKTHEGIRYYNDSFASGPGSAMAAMEAIPGMKVMIMGGYDRGLDLSELCEAIKKSADSIRKIVIIGASGSRLAQELTAVGFTNFVQTQDRNMPAILELARSQAQPGDAVVLSPAFASYDMFKNFEDRGIKFNQAVAEL